MMILREAGARLRALMRVFPVVMIIGPRQSGKTTLLRSALRGWRQLDLEGARDLALLESDCQGFLEEHPRLVAFDEAQRLPALFPALRVAADRSPKPGRYVLTGSSRPGLVETAGETLAGRLGILELPPFGLSELAGRPAWLKDRWFWGGYPRLYGLRGASDRIDWLEAYVATFLQQDLPGLGVRVPAPKLRRFWTMLVHVHGGLWNASDLARSLDLSVHTVNHYLDLFEGALVARRLLPFHANLGKRLTKSPKVYIRDTGILHRLAGLRSPEDLEGWPGRGASWEGLIVEELIRRAELLIPGVQAYFWRTQAGAEVDLVLVAGKRRVAVEIKASSAPSGTSLRGLRRALADLGMARGFMVYRGAERTKAGGGITLLPWRELDEALRPLA